MSLFRYILPALVVAAVVLTSCGGGGGSEQEKALKLAIVRSGDDPSQLPVIGVTHDCTINITHQAPVSESPLRPVDGKCLWNIAPQGDSWIATFRETWLCSDWTADASGFPPCDGITGFHEWEYLVNVPTGGVDILSSRGQFAPDM